MDQPRLFKIIGTPILIALIIAGLVNFMSSGADTYDVEYNSSEMEEIKEAGRRFKGVTEDTSAQSNISAAQDDYDKMGTMHIKGLGALNTVTQSYSLFASLLDSSLENLGMGGFSRTVKSFFVALITTVFVLGILLVAILRRKI